MIVWIAVMHATLSMANGGIQEVVLLPQGTDTQHVYRTQEACDAAIRSWGPRAEKYAGCEPLTVR